MQTSLPASTSAPQTITAWRELALDGASWAHEVMALRNKLETHGSPIFLHVGASEALTSRLQALQASARDTDRTSLIKNMPLFGVPFVVKDNIDVAGMPTTAACPAFSFQPVQSATAVARLEAAGALCLAKTNLDQFATGLVGTRSPYGAPSSVFDAELISGGSSAGSAVAVGAGLIPFALGTDTAGSGRIPAMFNHVVGLKPTPGRVSTQGVVPACASLDCVSVFALSVEDAMSVLAVIEGAQADDPFSQFTPGPARFAISKALATSGASTLPRLGIPASLPESVSPWVAEAYRASIEQLKGLGHTIVELDFGPLYDVADLLYNGPWVAERYVVIEALLRDNPHAIDPVVRQVIERATAFDSAATFRAQYHLRELRIEAEKIWQHCDCLVVPTAPRHPTHAQVAAEPIAVNAQLGQFTNFVNLLSWSALAIPVSRHDKQAFGLTLIGPAHADVALGHLAIGWQALFAQSPGITGLGTDALINTLQLDPASEACLPIVVVGAHLEGLPLNWQLTERGAYKLRSTRTAASYRFYALPGTAPPKPGLQRVDHGGHSIAVEVWAVPVKHVGSFLALIPAPLGLGTLELEDGQSAHGFLCEAHALTHATDISHTGGWRNYLRSIAPKP
jgi:allophanate hydrolase